MLRVNGKPPADGEPLVTERTKFIVVGAIPEINEEDDPKMVDRIQKILERRRDLETAARARGVRVVSLEDFLKYLGYKRDQRKVVPGRDVPNRVKPKSPRAAAFAPQVRLSA